MNSIFLFDPKNYKYFFHRLIKLFNLLVENQHSLQDPVPSLAFIKSQVLDFHELISGSSGLSTALECPSAGEPRQVLALAWLPMPDPRRASPRCGLYPGEFLIWSRFLEADRSRTRRFGEHADTGLESSSHQQRRSVKIRSGFAMGLEIFEFLFFSIFLPGNFLYKIITLQIFKECHHPAMKFCPISQPLHAALVGDAGTPTERVASSLRQVLPGKCSRSLQE